MARERPRPPMPWERYLDWWRRTPSNNSRDPKAPERVVRNAYDRYIRKWREADAMWKRDNHVQNYSDAEQRIREYAHTDALLPASKQQVSWRNIDFSKLEPGIHDAYVVGTRVLDNGHMVVDFETADYISDTVLVHLDGDRNNNDLSNLRRVSAHQAMEEGLTMHNRTLAAQLNSGFTIAEATKMGLKIAVVSFEELSNKTYQYLVPNDTTIAEGVTLYAVISRGTGTVEGLGHLNIGRITEIKDLIDSEYDGKLKHVVALFTAEEYNARVERQQKRDRLLVKAKKMAEEQHTIEKLTKLIGDSEEGRALLEQIKALE